MKGKTVLMVGAATIAMAAYGQAHAATTTTTTTTTHHRHHHHAVVTSTTTTTTSSSSTAAAGPTNAELEQRIEALEQQVQDNEAKEDSYHTRLSSLEQGFGDVQWTFDNGRPTIKSGDGRFSMSIRTRVQVDFADYMQSHVFHPGVPAAPNGSTAPACNQRDLCSGVNVRRAYFGIEGKAYNDFNYEVRLNFGGTKCESGFGAAAETVSCGDSPLNLARIAYVGIPNFRINAGIIQPVLTYGNSVSSADLTFMEFPSVVAAVISAGTTTAGTATSKNIQSAGFGGDDSRRGVELDYQKTDIFMPGDNLVIAASYTGQRTGSVRADDEGTNTNGRVAYRVWSDGTSNVQIGFDWGYILSMPGGHGHSFDISDRPESRVDGTQFVNTGVGTNCGLSGAQATALSAAGGTCTSVTGASTYGFEGGFNWENFYGAGEYYHFTQDRDQTFYTHLSTPIIGLKNPEYNGWYLEGSWVITGEVKPYSANSFANNYAVWGAPVPSRPFSLAGDSWGAWELAARYSTLDLNYNAGNAGSAVPFGGIRGGDQKIISAALNWYLNRNVRMIFEYQNVDVNILSAAGLNGDQSFNTAMGRLQFAF